MQVVYNTRFGMLWEDRGDLEDEESIMARREEYKAELPDGVLLLTCGVDTQDTRLEYEVVGHGHFGETWGIKKGIISTMYIDLKAAWGLKYPPRLLTKADILRRTCALGAVNASGRRFSP